jgi:hypothetical protein
MRSKSSCHACSTTADRDGNGRRTTDQSGLSGTARLILTWKSHSRWD